MVWVEVFIILLGEVLRTLFVPLRLLAYLPVRKRWQQRASEVLAAVADNADHEADTASLEAFFNKSRAPGRESPHLFLSAGEASGENHAAALLTALPDTVRCTAFGGQKLQSAGANLRFSLSDHAVMGFLGVLQKLPLILRAMVSYLRLLKSDPPDLVVLVDFPGLHVVMAKAAKRRKIPVLHYVAPQYWAWGPWRMRRYRRAVDATLTILPFETAFFRRFRIPAAYVGHPLLDELTSEDGTSSLPSGPATLVLLPGSRRSDIRRNLPGMLRVATALLAEHPGIRTVLPHENPDRTPLLRELLDSAGADFVEHHEGPLAPWLTSAHLVIAKSGTGSLSASLRGAPTVVVYQLRGLLSAIGYHNILSVPWIAAANLIAGRQVVPEHCFTGDHGWDDVLSSARELWPDGPARTAMQIGLTDVRARLSVGNESGGAAVRTAAIVGRFLNLPAQEAQP